MKTEKSRKWFKELNYLNGLILSFDQKKHYIIITGTKRALIRIKTFCIYHHSSRIPSPGNASITATRNA